MYKGFARQPADVYWFCKVNDQSESWILLQFPLIMFLGFQNVWDEYHLLNLHKIQDVHKLYNLTRVVVTCFINLDSHVKLVYLQVYIQALNDLDFCVTAVSDVVNSVKHHHVRRLSQPVVHVTTSPWSHSAQWRGECLLIYPNHLFLSNEALVITDSVPSYHCLDTKTVQPVNHSNCDVWMKQL